MARSTKPAPTTNAEAAGETPDAPFSVAVDASGRKWLTPKIPYDAFPGLPSDEEVAATAAPPTPAASGDDPTMVASSDRTLSGEPIQTPVEPSAPVVRPAEDVAASGDVLPAEDLLAEIAAVRNALSEKLLTVGSYNESFETIANDAWLMSALATIAQDHAAPISWKGNALLARDAAVGVAMASTGRGRQSFNAAQLANEQLSAVLNNNPPGLPTPDPAASREETADRAALMARMQSAFDKLKEAGSDEAALSKGASAATHEARVLAVLAKFTAHPDYGSSDEPDYQAAAAEIVSAGTATAEAAAANDHAGFAAAFDRVGTACNKCHEKYRFEN